MSDTQGMVKALRQRRRARWLSMAFYAVVLLAAVAATIAGVDLAPLLALGLLGASDLVYDWRWRTATRRLERARVEN